MAPMRRDWRFIAIVAALALVAVVRVASTHRVFSQVLDEPAHLAAGYEWFRGSYILDASHPPLARVLAALPLRLAGFPEPQATHMVDAGNQLLYHGNRYEKTLARTRIGNLLLLIAAIAATAAWARRTFSRGVAIIATALFTSLPTVLGHAGVNTTDLAALTGFVVALLTLDWYCDAPSPRRAVVLGIAIGAGLLAKFSFLVFFPPAAIVWLVAKGRRAERPPLHIAIASIVAFVVVWGGYRFDFRTPKAYGGDLAVFVFDVAAPEPLRPFARWAAANLPIPAPAFAVGLGMLQAHNKEGHEAFLFGEVRDDGWWYYFPAVFFYKTPIPFLLLALWGAILLIRERHRPGIAVLLCAAVVMLVSMTSGINIGVRHVLPLYAPLSIVAAYAVAQIWRRATDAFGRTALAALVVWLFGGVAAAHPDYLAWFNEAAQPNPAAIAVDSNLDWGQDILRLERTLRQMHITEPLYVDILHSVPLERHGIRGAMFNASQKVTGWLVVSETALALKGRHGEYQWLRTYRPVRRIGESIRLYHIP